MEENDNRSILSSQGLENRRKHYNTLSQQPIVYQAHALFIIGYNSSVDRLNEPSRSNTIVERDDYVHFKNVDSNETVS